MRDRKHRLGVSEVNLVRRHLKLEPVGQIKLQAAIAEVDQLYGLDAVTFDGKNHVLSLAYDASRICLDDIEETLKNYGIDVSHDWWTRYKEDYCKFVDGNIKENARREPWSCHKSPPSACGKR